MGFILFRRNCRSPDQVRGLVEALRGCVGRADAPVLIDQEGGRVARLRPPHWRRYPAAARIAALPDPIAARGGPARRAADRRRSGAARHHRRLPAGARPAGRRRRPGDRRPRLWQRSPTASRASAGRCARGCSPAACCRSSSTSPATAAPGSTAITPARWSRPGTRNCRAPISRRSARWRRCRGR